jgi:hypothetical protein
MNVGNGTVAAAYSNQLAMLMSRTIVKIKQGYIMEFNIAQSSQSDP